MFSEVDDDEMTALALSSSARLSVSAVSEVLLLLSSSLANDFGNKNIGNVNSRMSVPRIRKPIHYIDKRH